MTNSPPATALVLDAMGVIYSVGDDVADILCPFIREHGGETERSRIQALYREASLGRLSANAFWHAVHLAPSVEEDYLQRHRLSHGVLEFLRNPPIELSGIWCLSNDVSVWSQKLRVRFGLDQFIRGFVISGDVGARKPDPAIFHTFFAETAVEPHRSLFVDDRQANLDAAGLLGMATILFSPDRSMQQDCHPVASGFDELRSLIQARIDPA
jgi:FMN phosphatase YigB (HAD superfamily)